MTLAEAASTGDFATARELFQEYSAQLGIDLCFQGFAAELEQLASMYAPPGGTLILARSSGRPIGCGAVRRLSADTCEMKRLYLRPEARGMGLGRLIAERLVLEAKRLGYGRMVLDTLAGMQAARGLYGALGFRATEPYYDNPLPGAVYLALDLNEL